MTEGTARDILYEVPSSVPIGTLLCYLKTRGCWRCFWFLGNIL